MQPTAQPHSRPVRAPTPTPEPTAYFPTAVPTPAPTAYKPTFTPTATPSGITRFVTACVVILFFFSFRLIAVVLPLMTGVAAATAE